MVRCLEDIQEEMSNEQENLWLWSREGSLG